MVLIRHFDRYRNHFFVSENKKLLKNDEKLMFLVKNTFF